jgi:ubiquinone/menaquinone biosynthesis C-methylase UbiE
MRRKPECEYMDDLAEAQAYAGADFAAVNEAFVDRLMALVPAGPDDAIVAVDLGTGPGDIPIRIARRCPAWRITGVDASKPMIAIARQACRQTGAARKLRWLLADAAETHLPEKSFDVVLSNSILHHVSDPAAFWAEARRIAKPGATWLLRDLFRPTDEGRARTLVDQYAANESAILRQEYYRSLLSAYTAEELRCQLDAAGLQSLQVETVTDRHVDVFGRVS